MSNMHPDDVDPATKLSVEDLERVRRVTSTGVNAADRKPFKVWALLATIVVSILLLGQLSIFIANINI